MDSLHRKVKLHMAGLHLSLAIVYLSPYLQNGKLAYTVQSIAFFLMLGFMVAFFASIMYYHGDFKETEPRPN